MPAAATVTLTTTTASLTAASIGTQFKTDYNGLVNNQNFQNGLSATIFLKLKDVTNAGRDWTFTAIIRNTSVAPLTQGRVSGFGFGLEGRGASNNLVSITSSAVAPAAGGPDPVIFGERLRDNNLGSNVNIAQIGQIADACFMAGAGTANNCNGGGNGGLDMAEAGNPFPSTTQLFTLSFASSLSKLDLSDLFVRYQSLQGAAAGSGVGVGTIDVTYEPVPEPASWAMLIAGFGLVGASLRHRRMLAAA